MAFGRIIDILYLLTYLLTAEALKHDVDIPDQAAGQAVGGGTKRYRLAVLSCSL